MRYGAWHILYGGEGRVNPQSTTTDLELLRESLKALKERVEYPADRRCCPSCDEDGKAVELIAKLEERLLKE